VNSRQLLEVFDRYRDDAPVMVSSGRTGSILAQVGHRDPVMYNTGMSYTSPACLGLALTRPDLRVVAIEGDGAMLMGLAGLVTIGRYQPENLVVIVMNNRVYRSSNRGELATATAFRADVAGVARAAGIEQSRTVDTIEELEGCLQVAMSAPGPHVIVANVDGSLVLDPAAPAQEQGRLELSLAFRRRVNELGTAGRAAAGGTTVAERGRQPPPSVAAPAAELGAGAEAARLMYKALREAGIDFVVYLPDSILYPLQALAEHDPAMTTVCCTREDEGIAIASGAAYGGRWPAIIMEGTATGLSGLALAGLIVRRTPLLIVSSHTAVLGIRAPHDDIACMTNEPILRALNIPVAVIQHLDEAALVIRESQRAGRVLLSPVAVVVPPYVMSEPAPSLPAR
jgi:thiamine pyrophosphate-dependent acetolactate synthase large subunit-like protein